MSRYVDIEAVRPRMCELITAVLDLLEVDSLDSDNKAAELINTVNDLCNAIPTADVRSERHGHWEDAGCGDVQCSNCNMIYTGHELFPGNFCPCCSAKMDEERQQDNE